MATSRRVFEAPTPTILIRIDDVQRRTGYKKSAIYDWIKKGEFPLPVRPGRWDAAEIEEWIQQEKARRPKTVWDNRSVSDSSGRTDSRIYSPRALDGPSPAIDEQIQTQLKTLIKPQISSPLNLQSLQSVPPEFYYDSTSGSLFILFMKMKPSIRTASPHKESKRSR